MCFLKIFNKLKGRPGKEAIIKERGGDEDRGKESSRNDTGKAVAENKQQGKMMNPVTKEEPKEEEADQIDNGEEVAAFTTKSIKIVPCNCQDLGARKRQEDAFAFSDLSDSALVENKGLLAVVADGMGGLARGDLASQVAVGIFLREHGNKNPGDSFEHFLRRTVTIANYAVFDLGLDDNGNAPPGTTLVAVVIYRDQLHWVAAGDSQIFIYRDNRLRQLNREHIYANQLQIDVNQGLISRKEAENHPERGYLTSYLGLPELHELDISEEPEVLQPGDSVLLCSDGLTNTLTEEEISETLDEESGNIAEALVNKALEKEKRYQDNITVLLLKCENYSVNQKGDEENEK